MWGGASARESAKARAQLAVGLLPLGKAAAPWLPALGARLQTGLGFRVSQLTDPVEFGFAFLPARGQFASTAILLHLRELFFEGGATNGGADPNGALGVERPRTSDHGPRTTDLGPRTSDLGPGTTDHGPRTTGHGPATRDPRPATPNRVVLAVTDVDLCVPIFTFVFGEAIDGGPCAIVSGHRLRQEFYGLPPDAALFAERLLKMATHESGHMQGLRHCAAYRCVMATSYAIERVDLKSADFCPSCLREFRAALKPPMSADEAGRR